MSVKKSTMGDGPVKVGRIESRVALTKLRVLAPNDQGLLVDSEVLVRSDRFTLPWAKEVHKLDDGQEYILVPFDQVEGVFENITDVMDLVGSWPRYGGEPKYGDKG
jgi:hypothetical protein